LEEDISQAVVFLVAEEDTSQVVVSLVAEEDFPAEAL
jgi:hypothetical protein